MIHDVILFGAGLLVGVVGALTYLKSHQAKAVAAAATVAKAEAEVIAKV